jgi:hypothetical protein
MEKPEVVALIVLNESDDDEEDVMQIRTIDDGAPRNARDAVACSLTTRPFEGRDRPTVDLDALATQQEMDSSRDEEDFSSWPFRYRNKPAAASPSARAAAAAEARMAGNFLALDEENLLSDLFGSESGDAKNHSKNRIAQRKKQREVEEEASVEQPARKLRKMRSRERGVAHPKLKPLEIIGGEAKTTVKAPTSPAGAHDSLEDSVEDVDGEECPLCGQRFSADVLQAHVEAELEQGNLSSATTTSSSSSSTGNNDQAGGARPLLARSRSGAGAGVEVVVLDDDNDGEEEEIESSGETAECPFCQRRFRQGVELEEHVQHEMAVREPCRGGVASARARLGDEGEGRTKAPVTRPPLPLLRHNSRKLPSSFGAGAATAGTLSPYLTKRAQTCTRSPSSPPSPSASPTPIALVPSTQSAMVGGEDQPEDEDEDNYADVTFNFQCAPRPLL